MGRVTSFSYNGSGDLTSTTDAGRRTRSFGYDSGHQMLTTDRPARRRDHQCLQFQRAGHLADRP